MFPVLFAIPRTAGWLTHWQEMLDQDSKIARPRQLYIGDDARDYVPVELGLSDHPGEASWTIETHRRPERRRGNLGRGPSPRLRSRVGVVEEPLVSRHGR